MDTTVQKKKKLLSMLKMPSVGNEEITPAPGLMLPAPGNSPIKGNMKSLPMPEASPEAPPSEGSAPVYNPADYEIRHSETEGTSYLQNKKTGEQMKVEDAQEIPELAAMAELAFKNMQAKRAQAFKSLEK